MAPRILLCGDVVGKLAPLFKRVSSVSKTNGPFDALLCVGQFFPNDAKDIPEFMEFIEEKHEIPLPTYFIGDYGETAGDLLSSVKSKLANEGLKMEGFPICKNLYWLKGSGILYLHGLRIAYLGGKYVASLYQNPSRALSSGTYHEDDVDALRAFADEPDIVDIFLTNEWPFGILNGVAKPPEFDSANVGNVVVAGLAAELKPRYHIAGSEGVFYSREPYRSEDSSHVSRFVGLGAVGNNQKQKFLHALSPTPASILSLIELNIQPPNTTVSPYEALKSKDATMLPSDSNQQITSHESEGQYWRFSAPQNKRQKVNDGGATKVCFEFWTKGSCSRGDACNFKHDSTNDKPIPKGSCFDFVTKGQCERGSECRYRHSLDDDDYRMSNDRHRSNESKKQSSAPCWFCLASPDIDAHLIVSIGEQCYCALAKGGLVEGHALILPIEHLPSTVSLSQVAIDELNKYKKALHNMYVSQGKRMVVFERYLQLKTATHAHLQTVPIPVSKVNQARDAFVTAGKDLGFTFNFIRADTRNKHEALCKYLQGGSNYFYVELPDGSILAHVLEPQENMPMQLGREVCAKLLGIPERSDWKVCKLNKNEEVALTERFKENFRAYDPMIS